MFGPFPKVVSYAVRSVKFEPNRYSSSTVRLQKVLIGSCVTYDTISREVSSYRTKAFGSNNSSRILLE